MDSLADCQSVLSLFLSVCRINEEGGDDWDVTDAMGFRGTLKEYLKGRYGPEKTEEWFNKIDGMVICITGKEWSSLLRENRGENEGEKKGVPKLEVIYEKR